jgi:peptide-methionine (R)-S-oxide reductase
VIGGLFGIYLLRSKEKTAKVTTDSPQVREEKISIFDSQSGKLVTVDKITKTDEEWKKELTSDAYRVTRGKETEPPFIGTGLGRKEKGVYRCACCGTDLFTSDDKFDSENGWLNFWAPIAGENVRYKNVPKFSPEESEVFCARCDAYLGHFAQDGPPPTFKHFCVNSSALTFVKRK